MKTVATMLETSLMRMSERLNGASQGVWPTWSLNPHANVVKQGQHVGSYHDNGNMTGSALMLALLLPNIYGVPRAAPLRCFGFPVHGHLAQMSSMTYRCDVLEAILGHWSVMATQTDYLAVTAKELHQDLQDLWDMMANKIDALYRQQPNWNHHELPRHAIMLPDNMLLP